MPDNQLDKLFRPALVRYAIGKSAGEIAKDLRLFSHRNTILAVCFGTHSSFFLMTRAGLEINATSNITWLFVVGMICVLFPLNLWGDIKTYLNKKNAPFNLSRSPTYCAESVEVLITILELSLHEGKPHLKILIPCKFLGLNSEQTRKVWKIFLKLSPVKFYVRVDLKRIALGYLLTGQLPKRGFNAFAEAVFARARLIHSKSCSNPTIAKQLKGKSPASKFLKNCEDIDFEKRVWFMSWLICQQSELRGSAAEVCAARLNSILYRDDGRTLDERLIDIGANLDELGTHFSLQAGLSHKRVTRHLSEIALRDIANQSYNRLDCKLDRLSST